MSGQGQPHVIPLKLYFGVFGALVAGTWLTYWAALQDFGPLNTPIALAIAVTKATIVVLYFMHVRWSSKLTWVFACAGFLWLLILFAFVMSDYVSRAWLPVYI
jgi:cytochrome c oxidase subunit 4